MASAKFLWRSGLVLIALAWLPVAVAVALGVTGAGLRILSTDFPSNEPASTGYVVEFPWGQVARYNPQLVGGKLRNPASGPASDDTR